MASLTDAQTEALLADWERQADAWIEAHAKEGLELIFAVSEGIAGDRLKGPGGASLKMLLLRQRSLMKRWMREAFAEGVYTEWLRHPIPGEETH